MNAVTYGGARAPATAVTKRAQTEPHKSFFTRFMEALRESRAQQARRVLDDHAYLLPPNDPPDVIL
jgi:hypothetical protein